MDELKKDYWQAVAEWNQAQENFSNADPQYIDLAIEKLNICEKRVDVISREIRMEMKAC